MKTNENLAAALKSSSAVFSQIKAKRRKRRFWNILGVYLAILSAAMIMLLSYLWHFLDCYERTRPKHYMDDYVMRLWTEGGLDELFERGLVGWPTDDAPAAVQEYLKAYVGGKSLGYGKLPGYSELTPYYGIQAGGTAFASVLLAPSGDGTDFGFNFWRLDRVEILLAGKEYFISLPSSATALVDGEPLREDFLVSAKAYREDGPAGFPLNRLYRLTLYGRPRVVAADRFGRRTPLPYDAEKSLFSLALGYVTVPADVRVYADGRELGADCVFQAGLRAEGTFDYLYELQERFGEYEGLAEKLPIPTYTRYYIDFTFDRLSALDRFGRPYELRREGADYIGEAFPSDDGMYGECSSLALSAAEALALYLTQDLPLEAVKPYFPKDSEYVGLLDLYDCSLQAHSYPSFGVEKILEYKGYSDKLAYVAVYLEQHMNSRGVDIVNKITYPLWLLRLEDKWYVAGIDFKAFDNEYERFFN